MGPKITEPAAAPRKMVRSAPTGPTKAPTMAIIFMSPPPIAGFLKASSPSQPTAYRTRKPAPAPRTASSGVTPAGSSDRARPAASPPRLSGSGMR